MRWLSLGRTQRQLDEAAAQGGSAAALAETSVATDGSRAGAVAGTNRGTVEGVVNRMPVSWQPADADGSEAAPPSLVGGIAGENDGRIADCANLGAVSSANASADSAAAGIAGAGTGTVETSYSAGSVKAAANGAYLATTLTADGAYEDLVRASLYLAPGSGAAYEGIAVADRDGALPPDELQVAAGLLNDGREGDAAVWRSAEDAGDASTDGATRGYPAPARPASPDAAQPEPEPEALADEPAPAAADDAAPAAATGFRNWGEVAIAVASGYTYNGVNMSQYREDKMNIRTAEGLAFNLFIADDKYEVELALRDDIDLSGTQYTADGSPLPWTSWVLMGGVILNGNGCAISGMHVVGGLESKDTRSTNEPDGEGQNYADLGRGLFGGTGPQDNLRLMVTDLTIEGEIDLMAGTFDNAQPRPVAAGGLIGLVGTSATKTVLTAESVTSKVDVRGYGSTGGLVGCIGTAVVGTLTDCANKGTVFADGNSRHFGIDHDALSLQEHLADYSFATAGGLVGAVLLGGGRIGNHDASKVAIERCKNVGSVSSTYYAGGLVGYADGRYGTDSSSRIGSALTVKRSFNEGSVESTGGYANRDTGERAMLGGGGIAGGLVGFAYDGVYTQDCYNRGSVHSGFLAGGIFGTITVKNSPGNLFYATYSAAPVTASYYGNQTEGSGPERAPQGKGGGIAGYMNKEDRYSNQQFICEAGLTPTVVQSGSSFLGNSPLLLEAARMTGDDAFVNLLNQISAEPANPVWSRTPKLNGGYPILAVADGGAGYGSWEQIGKEVRSGSLREYKPIGEGTKDNPFRVTTPEALAYLFYIANNEGGFRDEYVFIRLGADIDLSGTRYGGLAWKNGSVAPALAWTPWLNTFYGSFEGAGHTISGLSVDAAGSRYSEAAGGLFLNVSTTRNFGSQGLETSIGGFDLEGSVTAGSVDTLGGVVGRLGCTEGSTENKVRLHDIESRVTIEPSGTAYYRVGGIVGKAGQTNLVAIERCGFSGSLNFGSASSVRALGGIAGEAGSNQYLATLQDCYSTGAINGCASGFYGGLVGGFYGSLKNSYVKPREFNVPVGTRGLVAYAFMAGEAARVFVDPTDLDEFNMQPVYQNQVRFDPIEVDSDYMKKGGFAASLNCSRENPVWGSPAAGENEGFPVLHGAPDVASWMEIGEAVSKGYLVDPEYNSAAPVGDPEGTFVLKTPEQLAYYAYHVRESYANSDGSYSDVSMRPEQKSVRIDAPALDMTGAAYGGTAYRPLEWEPIGNSYWSASGGGQFVSRPLYQVLFDGGDSIISHLRVQGAADDLEVRLDGQSADAALIGEALDCYVKNVRLDGTCASTGYVMYDRNRPTTAAGIVGTARSVRVEDCSSSATVTAVFNKASFPSSINDGGPYAAGIVGWASDDLNRYPGSAMISRCSNAGSVIAESGYLFTEMPGRLSLAGIAGSVTTGSNGSSLEDCYNTGNLSVNIKEYEDFLFDCGITAGSAPVGFKDKGPIVRSCYNTGVARTPITIMGGSGFNAAVIDGDRPSYAVGASGFDGASTGVSLDEAKQPRFVSALNAGRTGKDAPWVADRQGVNGGLPVFGINYSTWAEVGEAVDNGTLAGEGFVPTQEGTAADPYQISTPEALAWFAYKVNTGGYKKRCAKLTRNIDLSGTSYSGVAGSNFSNCLKWKPIASFSGDFDGGGYAVENLFVSESTGLVGFFGNLQGIDSTSASDAVSVHDFGVASGSVTGLHSVGGIAGRMNRLQGKAAVTVERCWNAASVTGTGADGSDTMVGGIAGYVFGIVSNCYNTGSVSAAQRCAGGIVGSTTSYTNYTRVENCYNTGGVTASSQFGAINGWHRNSTSPTTNCYYLDNGLPAFGTDGESGQATKLTSDQLKSWAVPYALNNSHFGTEGMTWTLDGENTNGGYPVFGASLRGAVDWAEVGLGVDLGLIKGDGFKPTQSGADAENAYQLGNEEALAWFAYKSNTDAATFYNKYAQIIASALDLTGEKYGGTSEAKLQWESISRINKEGTGGHGLASGNYEGTFDGGNCVISNLYQKNLSAAAGDGFGLFGFVSGGTVKNAVLENVEIETACSTTYITVGGIASQITGGATISGCAVGSGTIKGTVKSAYMVGGIVGDSHAGGGTIENCYVRASVKGTPDGGGGILGRALASGQTTLKNCYSACSTQGSPLCYASTGNAKYINCYYDSTLFTGNAERTGVKGLTTAQMQSWAAAYALNGNTFGTEGMTWTLDDASVNGGYPVFGTSLRGAADWAEVGLGVDAGLITGKPAQTGDDAASAYELGSPEAFAWFAYKVNADADNYRSKCAKLTQSIDLSGKSYTGAGAIEADFSNCLKWKPVNTSEATAFSGTFDGAGNALSNLNSDGGLFHQLSGTVQDLGVESGRVGGNGGIGAMADDMIANSGAKVLRCYNKADVVVGSEIAWTYVGGIVGVSRAGTAVENCFNTGNVTIVQTTDGSGTTFSAAGVVGYLYGGTMRSCYNAGAVSQGGNAQNSFSCMVTRGGSKATGCYYDSSLMKAGNTGEGGTGLTTEQLKSWAAAWALNGKNTGTPWTYDASKNAGYPSFGTLAAPADWAEVGLGVDAGLISGKPAQTGADAAHAYEIATPEALAWLAYKMSTDNENYKRKCAKLTAPIDLSGASYGGTAGGDFSGCLKWTPLGTDAGGFDGRFDGGGWTVKNLRVDRSESGAAGLFCSIGSGRVVGLGIESGSVRGNGYVGGVVGIITGRGGTVERCWNGASVSSSSNAAGGGIAGFIYGTVRDCYNLGAVGGLGYKGGIVGFAGDGTSVVGRCYNAGRSESGAVVGREGSGATIAGNYYLEGTGSDAGLGADKARELTAEQLESWGAAYALNGGNGTQELASLAVWRKAKDAGENTGYPVLCAAGESMDAAADWAEVGAWVDVFALSLQPSTGDGTAATPYEISSPGQLAWFAYKVNTDNGAYSRKRAKLTQSIDLSGKEYTGAGTIEADFSNCLKWKPIASFSGDFDGGGHAVENLLVSESTERAGFFGRLQGVDAAADSAADAVSVHDFGVASGAVTGLHTVGGIVGDMKRLQGKAAVRVERCWNAASVTGTGANSASETMAGGIVGYALGTVSNCYNTGSVSAAARYAGGIAGSTTGVGSYTRVESCYNTGGVTASSLAGAINGWHMNSTSPTTNCYYLDNGLPAFGNNDTAGQATKLTSEQLKSWKTAYLLNGSAYVGGAGGTAPASTVWTTDEQKNGKDGLKNGGYPVFGDLRPKELSVTFEPKSISTAADSSMKTTGKFMDGLIEQPLSGPVTLERAPENPSGATLASTADVTAKFSTWGTESANKTFALAAGNVSLTPSSAIGGSASLGADLTGIDLYTAAAYTSGETRETSFVVADANAHYKVNVTVNPVTSKTLDVTLPVESASSFELSPDGKVHEGDSAAKAAEPSVLKSNNALPLAGRVKNVEALATGAKRSLDGGEINAVLNPAGQSSVLEATTDPVADDDPATPDNVKLFVASSGEDASLTVLGTPLYYDPQSSTVPLYFAIPGSKEARWKWGMDYTGTYVGQKGVFGYAVSYEVGLSASDLTVPSLNGVGYAVAPGVYATEPYVGGEKGRYNVEWNRSAS